MSRNYLIWQYHDKPKALGTIKALYASTDETFQTVISITDLLSINKATGYALDLVGRRVGISRILNQAIAKEYFGFVDSDTSLAFGLGAFYRYGDSLSKTVKLSDDDFRFFIKAKILKNYQTGTIENIVDSVQLLTGVNGNVVDNLDMTMNVIVNAQALNTLTLYAIKNLDILVRPVGVLYQFLVLVSDEPFGFYSDNTAFGFGAGKFVRLQQIGIKNESTK